MADQEYTGGNIADEARRFIESGALVLEDHAVVHFFTTPQHLQTWLGANGFSGLASIGRRQNPAKSVYSSRVDVDAVREFAAEISRQCGRFPVLCGVYDGLYGLLLANEGAPGMAYYTFVRGREQWQRRN